MNDFECSNCGDTGLLCTYGDNQGLWRIRCRNGHQITAAPGFEITVGNSPMSTNEHAAAYWQFHWEEHSSSKKRDI